MTSQFKSIIEKIKTDKNVQVAVASIAAATVLVIGGTIYYISQTQSQIADQTYKTVTSVGSKKYEKVRNDDASDVKLDDKLVESISSANSSYSSTAVNPRASNDSSLSFTNSAQSNQSTNSTNSTQSTQSTQSNQSTRSDDSSRFQEVSSNSKEDYKDRVESDSEKKDSSKTKGSETKVPEIYSNRKNSKSKRSTDQSDWESGDTERVKSEEVSSDNWNDEDSVEELNLHR